MTKDLLSRTINLPKRLIIFTNLIAIIASTSAVILTYLDIFPFQSSLGLYRILPGDILIDFIWVWCLAAISGIIIYAVSPYLARFFIGLHRVFTGGAYDYHIQVRESNDIQSSSTRRLILPAFVSLGFSFTLTNSSDVMNSLFVVENFDSLPEGVAGSLLVSMPMFFILLLLVGLITILFAPAWLLEDNYIICEKKNKGSTTEIEGIGNWYLTLMKGFAGISTIIVYVFISIDMITWFQLLPTYTVEVPIWLFLIPVFVVVVSPLIALAPISFAYAFYAVAYTRNSRNLKKHLTKMEIDRVSVEVKPIDSL